MPESCSVMVTVASPLFCLPSLVWTELLVDPRHRTDEVYVWDGAEAGVRGHGKTRVGVLVCLLRQC